MLTQEFVKSRLSYSSDTGIFHRIKSSRKDLIGKPTGCLDSHGHIQISLDRKYYLAHRLAWLYVYGVWPDCQIDHINRNRLDNRICNLRIATNAQNTLNSGARTNNKSGLKGVCWKKSINKWIAQYSINGKKIHIGCFHDKHDAYAAYCDTVKSIHGDFYFLKS